jgi:hypothetical protein
MAFSWLRGLGARIESELGSKVLPVKEGTIE